jgi:hypothetical protein
MVVRRPKRSVETSAYLAFVARVLSAAGPRVGEADPQDLRDLVRLRELIDEAILEAVRGLRDSGCTWEEIGTATGTTRQAAIMKWTHRL